MRKFFLGSKTCKITLKCDCNFLTLNVIESAKMAFASNFDAPAMANR